MKEYARENIGHKNKQVVLYSHKKKSMGYILRYINAFLQHTKNGLTILLPPGSQNIVCLIRKYLHAYEGPSP